MRSVLLVAIVLAAGSAVAESEQDTLSWTDENSEQPPVQCSNGKFCFPSKLTLRALGSSVVGKLRLYSFSLLIFPANVYPPEKAANSIDITITFETADRAKNTLVRNDVPVEDYVVDGKVQAPATRHASTMFTVPDIPVVNVLAVDTVEKFVDPDGRVVKTFHKFRPSAKK